MFNYGDKVKFIYAELHKACPEFYPEEGTIGIHQNGDFVKWPDGSTSMDDLWSCADEYLELFEAAPVPERRFKVGDRIVGTSTKYSITGIGWKGYVRELLGYHQIRVGTDKYSFFTSTWDVDENCFELVAPKRDAEGHAICSECGKVVEDESTMVMIDDEFYCEECLEEYFGICDHCGKYVRLEDLNEVDGANVCDHCLENSGDYFMCRVCEEWHSFSNNYADFAGGGYICDDCMDYNDNVVRCDDCGTWLWYDDAEYDEDNEEYFCADCERRRDSKAIHNYGYKPDPIFKAGTHDQFYSDSSIKELLFGVELEIDKGNNPGKCAQEIIDNTEDIYCKHDGSLSDGVEIVSHPCTLEYHHDSLGWDKICEIARKHSFLSQDANTCGLHVHVGRNQMGEDYRAQEETAGKVVLLVDRHWDSLVKFSRRKAARLDQWASRPCVRYENVRKYGRSLTTAALNTVDNGRYQAVNLENDATVEFRLFCGTLKASTIYATLQLVSNIVTYAKDHTPEDCMTSKWTDITDVASYDELTEYLKNREIVDGCEPTEYNWKPEKSKDASSDKVKYEDRRPREGDTVRIINSDGRGIECLHYYVGETARIAVARTATDGLNYLVDFGHEGVGLHNGGNAISSSTGYWVREGNIAVIATEASDDDATRTFNVGDRVRVVNDDGDDVPDLYDLIGEEATVAIAYENGEAMNFEYGIVFDEHHEGLHTLYSHGRCVESDEVGYSVYGHNLALVSAA